MGGGGKDEFGGIAGIPKSAYTITQRNLQFCFVSKQDIQRFSVLIKANRLVIQKLYGDRSQ